jgi:hypothetical protein
MRISSLNNISLRHTRTDNVKKETRGGVRGVSSQRAKGALSASFLCDAFFVILFSWLAW